MGYLLEADSIMSKISKIFNAIGKAKNKAQKEKTERDNDNNYIKGSISEYSKDLIMTFPMLCDNSLPAETASMISKANERNLVSMLRMLFASMQMNGTNGAEIVSRVHKNINASLSLDDYIDAFDDIRLTAKNYEESFEYKRGLKVLSESMKNWRETSFPVNSFSETSLNEYIVSKNPYSGKLIVNEYKEERKSEYRFNNGSNTDTVSTNKFDYRTNANGEYTTDDLDSLNYILNRSSSDRNYKLELDKLDQNKREYNHQLEMDKARISDMVRKGELSEKEYKLKLKEFEERKRQFEKEYEISKKKLELQEKEYEYKKQQYRDQHTTVGIDRITKQLVDQDVKKCNELTPTLMTVTFNTMDTDGTLYNEKTFLTGVKSRVISVDAIDIIERLIAKNRTKVSFLNLIRATTGEISFVKDFLLCTKQAKIDAKNAVKKGPAAKMWKVLEARSTKNNWNKLNRKGNDASSITTLVINQETANLMKKEYEFNIENIRNARMIMDAYNLLCIVVCDESIEVAKFIYAGNDSYEQQSYSSLEKEAKDNSYKKVINLIGQMNGR